MESNEKKINMIEAGSDLADKVLVEPWITEASTAAAELHKYVFSTRPNIISSKRSNPEKKDLSFEI